MKLFSTEVLDVMLPVFGGGDCTSNVMTRVLTLIFVEMEKGTVY